jgi:spore coat protein H
MPVRRLSGHLLSVALLAACGSEPAEPTNGDTQQQVDAGETESDASSPQLEADAGSMTQEVTQDLLFAEESPIWHFDLTVAAADLDWLNTHAVEETYVPGAITFQGQRVEDISVRYKGGFGSLQGCFDDAGKLTCSKLSLKVSFNESDKEGRFLGLRKLIFHACNRDRTCLRERLSYGLFRDMGIETSRAAHATVSINGGPKQLYALVEYIDREFLEAHFDDPEGNLYKERWPVYDQPSYYVDELVTNEDTPDVTRMLAFAGAVRAATPANYEATIAPYLDLERMGRYSAVDQLVNDWDGIWKFYCNVPGQICGNHNYYVYDDPGSDHFAFIPWDVDHTLTEPNPDLGRAFSVEGPGVCDITPIEVAGLTDVGIRNPQCDPLLRGVYTGPGWQRYRKALEQLVRGEKTKREALLARLNHYRAKVRLTVPTDPSALPLEEWDAAVAVLRQIIIEQYEAAEVLLDER